MPLYRATVDLLIEADSEAEACDAVSETLRQHTRKFAAEPDRESLLDWQYASNPSGALLTPTPTDGTAFAEWSQDNEPIGAITPDGQYLDRWDERLRAAGCSPIYKKS